VPPGREHAAIAFDPVRREVVLFGGFGKTDTWIWDGTNWEERIVSPHPEATGVPSMAWDTANQRMVLVTDRDPVVTWFWNGSAWSPSTATGPTSTYYPAIAPSGSGVLLFQGNTTYRWQSGDWVAVTVSSPAPTRNFVAFAYDSLRDRNVLIAGQGTNSYVGEVWELAGTAWSERIPQLGPSRWSPAIAALPLRGTIAMYGGLDSRALRRDMGMGWRDVGATRDRLATGRPQRPRHGHADRQGDPVRRQQRSRLRPGGPR
jgi:hypothetical protein